MIRRQERIYGVIPHCCPDAQDKDMAHYVPTRLMQSYAALRRLARPLAHVVRREGFSVDRWILEFGGIFCSGCASYVTPGEPVRFPALARSEAELLY